MRATLNPFELTFPYIGAYMLADAAVHMDAEFAIPHTSLPTEAHEIDYDLTRSGYLWCGPAAVSALTGAPISEINALIRQHRRVTMSRSPRQVVGTDDCEVAYAFAQLGYEMHFAYLFCGTKKKPPTFGHWLRTTKLRANVGYLIRLEARDKLDEFGKKEDSHWCVVLNDQYICSRSLKWRPIARAMHKSCRVENIYAVIRVT